MFAEVPKAQFSSFLSNFCTTLGLEKLTHMLGRDSRIWFEMLPQIWLKETETASGGGCCLAFQEYLFFKTICHLPAAKRPHIPQHQVCSSQSNKATVVSGTPMRRDFYLNKTVIFPKALIWSSWTQYRIVAPNIRTHTKAIHILLHYL